MASGLGEEGVAAGGAEIREGEGGTGAGEGAGRGLGLKAGAERPAGAGGTGAGTGAGAEGTSGGTGDGGTGEEKEGREEGDGFCMAGGAATAFSCLWGMPFLFIFSSSSSRRLTRWARDSRDWEPFMRHR